MSGNNMANTQGGKGEVKAETKPTIEQLMAELAKLQAEKAELLKKNEELADEVGTLRVSEKGAVSLYGFGRFPVTLYGSQWEAVLDLKEKILAFIKANQSKLKTKEQAQAERKAEKAANDKLAQVARASEYEVKIVDGKPVPVKKSA